MRILNTVADRLLARFVPGSKASAATRTCQFECKGAQGAYECCFEDGVFVGCTKIGDDC